MVFIQVGKVSQGVGSTKKVCAHVVQDWGWSARVFDGAEDVVVRRRGAGTDKTAVQVQYTMKLALQSLIAAALAATSASAYAENSLRGSLQSAPLSHATDGGSSGLSLFLFCVLLALLARC